MEEQPNELETSKTFATTQLPLASALPDGDGVPPTEAVFSLVRLSPFPELSCQEA